MDGDHYAALGRAVELGEHDARDSQRLRKHPRLRDSVLPRGGVEYHQDFVGGGRVELTEDALDFLEFFHEVGLCMEPAGGVDYQVVALPGDRGREGVVGHGGGVGPRFVLHYVRP